MVDLWTFVAGGLVGIGGLVAGTIKDVVSQRLQRRDKDRDRDTADLATHRRELRDAYAAFIAAYGRLLTIGNTWATHEGSMHTIKNNAHDRAIEQGADGEIADSEWESATNADLEQRIREVSEQFTAASVDAERAAVGVQLLENDKAAYARLQTFTTDPVRTPRRPDEAARFQLDLADRRERLDELTLALSGRFAPASPTTAITTTKRTP